MNDRPDNSFEGIQRKVFLGGSCGAHVGDEHDWRTNVVIPVLRCQPPNNDEIMTSLSAGPRASPSSTPTLKAGLRG